MSFTHHTQTIGPVRGLIATANRQGTPYRPESIRRWLRLNRTVFKADKVDMLIGDSSTELCLEYLNHATVLNLRLSLRSTCDTPPPDLSALQEAGLLDVYLTPSSLDQDGCTQWLDAAREAGLPIRIQLPIPQATSDVSATTQILAQRGVKVVNLSAYDSFNTKATSSNGCLKTTQQYVESLEPLSIEANILHVPFCQVDKSCWPNVINNAQFFKGHQHYLKSSYALAEQLYPKGAVSTSIILQILQRRHTLMNDPIDNKLLPWLTEKPWLRARVVAWHRLTRHLRLTRAVPKPLAIESEEEAEQALKEKLDSQQATLGSTCGPCRMRAICNRDSYPASTGQPCKTIEGDLVVAPLHFSSQRKTWCDPIDEARFSLPERQEALANAARTITEGFPPTNTFNDSYDYSTVGQWCHQLPGGVRWYGFTNSEKRSTSLATLYPPFTISYVVGGGIAEYAGFSLGQYCTLVCPMETFQHTITLHVADNGDYVLLRDGDPVQPVQFEGHGSVPARLGNALSPRISLWNIDESVVTQNVKLWHDEKSLPAEDQHFHYSIVTVCVRYARRLQVMLQSIAHQQNFDLSTVEIIVAYVPDVDATEDVIESIALAHPELTIRRVTISEDKSTAKGFIINDCVALAQGDWVALLDADTLIPPTFFSQLNEHTKQSRFIVPDGRKLLSPETTAQVLLGNKTPWDHWDSLIASEGEMRHREMDGVPIGFCQIVRRDCFEQVKYYEADHFEGADWQFSIEMRKVFGEETRLSGVPLLHLDHGGSKWYGTTRHY